MGVDLLAGIQSRCGFGGGRCRQLDQSTAVHLLRQFRHIVRAFRVHGQGVHCVRVRQSGAAGGRRLLRLLLVGVHQRAAGQSTLLQNGRRRYGRLLRALDFFGRLVGWLVFGRLVGWAVFGGLRLGCRCGRNIDCIGRLNRVQQRRRRDWFLTRRFRIDLDRRRIGSCRRVFRGVRQRLSICLRYVLELIRFGHYRLARLPLGHFDAAAAALRTGAVHRFATRARPNFAVRIPFVGTAGGGGVQTDLGRASTSGWRHRHRWRRSRRYGAAALRMQARGARRRLHLILVGVHNVHLQFGQFSADALRSRQPGDGRNRCGRRGRLLRLFAGGLRAAAIRRQRLRGRWLCDLIELRHRHVCGSSRRRLRLRLLPSVRLRVGRLLHRNDHRCRVRLGDDQLRRRPRLDAATVLRLRRIVVQRRNVRAALAHFVALLIGQPVRIELPHARYDHELAVRTLQLQQLGLQRLVGQLPDQLLRWLVLAHVRRHRGAELPAHGPIAAHRGDRRLQPADRRLQSPVHAQQPRTVQPAGEPVDRVRHHVQVLDVRGRRRGGAQLVDVVEQQLDRRRTAAGRLEVGPLRVEQAGQNRIVLGRLDAVRAQHGQAAPGERVRHAVQRAHVPGHLQPPVAVLVELLRLLADRRQHERQQHLRLGGAGVRKQRPLVEQPVAQVLPDGQSHGRLCRRCRPRGAAELEQAPREVAAAVPGGRGDGRRVQPDAQHVVDLGRCVADGGAEQQQADALDAREQASGVRLGGGGTFDCDGGGGGGGNDKGRPCGDRVHDVRGQCAHVGVLRGLRERRK